MKIKNLGKYILTIYSAIFFATLSITVVDNIITTEVFAQTSNVYTPGNDAGAVQQAANNTSTLGPFQSFAVLFLDIFNATRNFIYILIGFALLWFFKGYADGTTELDGAALKKVVGIIIALILIAGIGYILEAVVGGNNPDQMQNFIPANTIGPNSN